MSSSQQAFRGHLFSGKHTERVAIRDGNTAFKADGHRLQTPERKYCLRMPRVQVKNANAKAHPREFALLHQLGGSDAVEAEVCSC
jgi:aminoglycoside phosphotransferase (APT) family kinase protein